MAKRNTASAPVAEVETTDASIRILARLLDVETRLIARDLIHPDPEQPRKNVDAELREDLRRRGQLDPITVRPHPTIMTEWMIVNGERRWRSSEGVLPALRCQIRDDVGESLSERMASQLSHNLGKPLSALEEARAFGVMLADTGMPVADLADFLGRPASTVAERVSLLELGPWLAAIESGALTMSHAVKVLLPLRRVSDEIHAKVMEQMYGGDLAPDPDGQEQTVDQFRKTAHSLFKPFLYPLTKSKGHGAKNPEFNTAKHDAECGCGGIKIALGYEGERTYCGNPEWWKPLDRAARKAQTKKGGSKVAPRGGKVLYLPHGTKTVKSSYGATPSGVVQLTDSNGDWSIRQDRDAFDPADLPIDETKLVRWEPGYGSSYPSIGTTDLAAVRAARSKWAARWEGETIHLRGELTAAIRDHRAQHAVEGTGAAAIASLVSTQVTAPAMLDVALARSIPVPSTVTKGSHWEIATRVAKWAKDLSDVDAAEILTGLAVITGLDLLAPTARIEQLQRKALEGIRKREIPWKKKPKAAKVETPAPAKKASSSRPPKVAFMQDMYPSRALVAVLGPSSAKGLPRTEVTKKLWAYIKRQKLQDEKNRRLINADEKLLPIFGKKSVSLFDMTKLVNSHLFATPGAADRASAKVG